MSKIGRFNAKLGYCIMLCLAFLVTVFSLILLVSGDKYGFIFWLLSVLIGIWYSHTESSFLTAKPHNIGSMVTHIVNTGYENLRCVEIYQTGVLLRFMHHTKWLSLNACKLDNQGLTIYVGKDVYLIQIDDLKRKLIEKLDFEG